MRHLRNDLLSKLHDNVINEILIRLPFRDAVRTSILSTEWRYKWRRLSHLMLDYGFLRPNNFKSIIHNIITHHSGSVTKFILCIQYWRICPRIHNLLRFLSRKNVKHLVLRLPERSRLHSSFFKCLKLRHLFLQNCLVVPPTGFEGFKKLTTLELHEVTISPKLLESFISHCLLLEQLVLKFSDTLSDIIEINAPSLRSFDFRGDMETICLKCVPRLAKLSLMHHRNDWKKFAIEKFLTSNFFESCSVLEHLRLDYSVARGQKIPTKLPLDVLSVEHLCMCIYLARAEILSALCLIRSFPFLRYLEIEMELNIDHTVSALNCLKVEAFPNMMFLHLTEVVGSKRDMQLIKLLLAKSPVLVKMTINLNRYLIEYPILDRLAEVAEFEAASPEAKVFFIPTIMFDQQP